MSVQAMTWVLDHSATKLAERLVLLAIANHADADGTTSFPRVERIASEAGVGMSTARRCIQSLERGGHIDLSAGGGRGLRNGKMAYLHNEYTIVMDPTGIVTRQAERNPLDLSGLDTNPLDVSALNLSDQPSQIERPTLSNRAAHKTKPKPSSETSFQPSFAEESSHADPSNSQTPKPAPKRGTNPLWDALVASLGLKPSELTNGARGRIAAALRDLQQVDATPEEIERRARRYCVRYPKAALTATALAKHWPDLNADVPLPTSGSKVYRDADVWGERPTEGEGGITWKDMN